jgi:hypothetical protein
VGGCLVSFYSPHTERLTGILTSPEVLFYSSYTAGAGGGVGGGGGGEGAGGG